MLAGHRGISIDRVIALLEARREELGEQARTIWHDTTPVGAYGVVTISPGVAEAWSLLTEGAVHLPIKLVREVRAAIREAWRVLPIHRMQALCLRDDWISYRWLGGLGFHDEGIQRARGPRGEDMVMFGMWEKPAERRA